MSLRKRTEGTSRLILFEVRIKLSNPDRSGITKAGEKREKAGGQSGTCSHAPFSSSERTSSVACCW